MAKSKLGRKVDTFDVRHEGQKYVCVVFMKVENYPLPRTRFTAVCAELSLEVDAGDVVKARAEANQPVPGEEKVTVDDVKNLLIAQIRETAGTVWEDHLHVTLNADIPEPRPASHPDGPGRIRQIRVTESRGHSTIDGHLTLAIVPVQLGTTRGGEKVHRYGLPKPGGRDISYANWPEVGVGEGRFDDRHVVRALVKDTPENRAALEGVYDGLEKLRGLLAGFFHPKGLEDRLKASLEALKGGGLMALPAPPPAPKKRGSK